MTRYSPPAPWPDNFERDFDRYLVFKMTDLKKHYPTDIDFLEKANDDLQAARVSDGKSHLQCIVVESDWPEYEPTWDAIEKRMTLGESYELEPCPKNGCDGDPHLQHNITAEIFWVQCSECNLNHDGGSDTELDAVWIWNNEVTAPLALSDED